MMDKLVVDCTTGAETVEPLTRAEQKQLKADSAAASEAQWAELRIERAGRLAASDWTQLPDSELDKAAADKWKAYRKQLRELPTKTDDPANPKWPNPPR